MKHTATCSCGQLSLTFTGEIRRTSICHCVACQKRTGSVFGVQTRVERASSVVEGKAKEYRRFGDDPKDGEAVFSFCPDCGATLYWELACYPEHYIVGVGSFADRHLPAPVFSVYEARMHSWVKLPESVETHWD